MECITLASASHKKKDTGKKQLPLTSLFGLNAQCLLQVFLCYWENPQNNSIFNVSRVAA